MADNTIIIDPYEAMFTGPSWNAYKQHLISKEALGGKVSDNSLTHYNRHGYYGIYQMGVQALEEIGYIKPGTYKKMKSKKLKQIEVLGDDTNWSKGKSLKWFSSRASQEAAIEALTRKNFNAIKGALKEKKIEGLSDIYGYLTAAHLGGASTAKKYIKEGTSSFKDANNTSVMKYKDSFAAYYKKNIGDDTPRQQVIRGDQFKSSLPVSFDPGRMNAATEYIMSRVETAESTLGRTDLGEIRKRIAGLLDKSIVDLNPEGDFIDKTISAAYDSADQTELREILVPDVKTLGEIEMLTPSIQTIDNLPEVKEEEAPKQEMSYGGTLQPNGRKTTFYRPEDQKAQSKTTK